MDIKLNEQIPEIIPNRGIMTLAPITPMPVEQSFLQALSGRKIKETTPAEIAICVHDALEQAWFDLGLKEIPDDDYEKLKLGICNEIIACFSSLTLAEIANSIYYGARGRFGKVYSLTVVVVSKWFADYLTDNQRLDAIKSLKPKELPVAKPTPDQLFNLSKDCLWRAIDKYQQKLPLGTLVVPVYKFLNELGLIIYDKQEKWAFMAKGLERAIDETRLELAKPGDDNKTNRLKRQLSHLLAANEPDTPMKDEDYITLVKNKAMELTLEDWFNTCEESGFDINELVESKKHLFSGK